MPGLSLCASTVGRIVLCLALPMMSFANSLSTAVNGSAGFNPASGNGGMCSNTGTASASCSNSFTGTAPFGLGPYSGSLTAAANAAYGSLSASVDVSSTVNIPFDVRATASFLDALTIFGGSGIGYIDYTLAGTITTISDFGNGFTFQQAANTPESFFTSNANQVNVPFSYDTALYQFTFGTPFTVQVSAFANTVGSGDGFGQGRVNVMLDQIAVFDSSRRPITSFTVTSQSGTVYPTAIPEPSSLLLLGTLVSIAGGFVCKATNRLG